MQQSEYMAMMKRDDRALGNDELVAAYEQGIDDLRSAEVARRQRQVLGSKGETLFLASGNAGEQSVFHLHLHVVPRTEADALDLTSWWAARIRNPSREDLDSIAAQLRS